MPKLAAKSEVTVDDQTAKESDIPGAGSAMERMICIRCMQQKPWIQFAKPGRKELLKTCLPCCLVSHACETCTFREQHSPVYRQESRHLDR